MLISMLSMIFFSETTFATGVTPSSFAPAGVWIKLLINFHRPKLDCASGFGLCFDVSWGFEENLGAYSAKNLCAVRGLLNSQNQLLIEVSEAALTSYDGGSALPYFKDKRTISIVDAYTLSDETCKALQSSSGITIRPGNYPLSYQNGVYTIVFQL